jgi:hypothetical protein
MTKTDCPASWAATATLITVVVFPLPPFCEMIAIVSIFRFRAFPPAARLTQRASMMALGACHHAGADGKFLAVERSL